MAHIIYEVTIDDLENGQVDSHVARFDTWLKEAYKGRTAPAGTITDVSESDREMDESEEGE